MASVPFDICTTVIRLTPGILNIKENLDSFYEHMYILASHEMSPLASHEMSPLIVLPSDLRNILLDIKKLNPLSH